MKNVISMYMHCRKCLEETPDGETYTPNLAVGWTPKGLQVWCEHHDCNVAAIDFLGQKIAFEGEARPH